VRNGSYCQDPSPWGAVITVAEWVELAAGVRAGEFD
jgi:hypothetical protein